MEQLGYWAPFLAMALESACVPISSEVVLLLVGVLIARSELSLLLAALAAASGFTIGAMLPYLLGRRYGRRVLETGGRLLLAGESEVERVERWFTRYGEKAILLTRMIPVVRDFISFPAGTIKMPLARFVLYTFFGVLPWPVLILWLGTELGRRWDTFIELLELGGQAIWLLLGLGFGLLVLRKFYLRYRERRIDV